MAKNRKNQSAAIRFGPAIKAFLLCALVGGAGVGYVWQKGRIGEARVIAPEASSAPNSSRRARASAQAGPGGAPRRKSRRSTIGWRAGS